MLGELLKPFLNLSALLGISLGSVSSRFPLRFRVTKFVRDRISLGKCLILLLDKSIVFSL